MRSAQGGTSASAMLPQTQTELPQAALLPAQPREIVDERDIAQAPGADTDSGSDLLSRVDDSTPLQRLDLATHDLLHKWLRVDDARLLQLNLVL